MVKYRQFLSFAFLSLMWLRSSQGEKLKVVVSQDLGLENCTETLLKLEVLKKLEYNHICKVTIVSIDFAKSCIAFQECIFIYFV